MRKHLIAPLLTASALLTVLAPAASAAALYSLIDTCGSPLKYLPIGPSMSVGAADQNISISGFEFSTSGRVVTLDVYGLTSTSPVLITTGVIPATSSGTCLIACTAGSFWTEVTQPNDPCVNGAGFNQVRVVAWTTGRLGRSYKAASADATVTCPIVQ
jgi:hypothetical protein